MIEPNRRFAAAILWAVMGSVFATPPLMDSLEFQSETSSVRVSGEQGLWLPLPHSPKLQEMRRTENCSAVGGPVGTWRIAENRLWLTGLYRCGGDVALSTVYGKSDEPLFAYWVTAELLSNRGTVLCGTPGFGDVVWERKLTIKVEKGLVTLATETSNEHNPAVPKAAKSRPSPPCLPAARQL